MKNRIFISTLMVLFAIALRAQGQAIIFETSRWSWSEIKAKAQQEHKMIFVDAFTTWCGPCKWMANNTFSKDTVANYYNSTFINVKIDMEKGEGLSLAKEWSVNAYPSLLYISPQGEILHRACGVWDASHFIQLGKEAIMPETQFATAQKKYTTGTADADFVADYIVTLSSNCLPYEQEGKQYFSSQKEEELINKRNWSLIQAIVSDIDSREFKYVETHVSAFEKEYGEKEVSEKIGGIYTSALMNAIFSSDTAKPRYEKLRASILERKSSTAAKAVAFADLEYYKKKQDWTKYVVAANKYVTEYGSSDEMILNNVAYDFYTYLSDKAQLEKALVWAKKSVALDNNYYNNDTYASLLYKLGKKDKAKKAAMKSIALAQGKADASKTIELLKKIIGFKG